MFVLSGPASIFGHEKTSLVASYWTFLYCSSFRQLQASAPTNSCYKQQSLYCLTTIFLGHSR